MKKTLGVLLILFIASCLPLTAAYQYHGPEVELITLVNAERKANNVPPLAINWELARLARYKTEEMKTHQLISHESLIYGDPNETLDRFEVPYKSMGANIAMGQETAHDVIEAWLSTPGHHANLINPEYTSAGVGLSFDDNNIPYWTLILIAE